MTPGSQTLYEVLGAPHDASPKEIEEAYYRQVRKHPPEKDSEGFQRITRAHEVLSQPASRREYDETRRTDEITQGLIEEGRELLEENDEEALTPLKRALMRHPDSPLIRDLVVQAFMVQEDWEEAEKHAQKVLRQEPKNPAYNVRMGDICSAQEDHSRSSIYFRRAMELDPENPAPTIRYVWSLTFDDRTDDAVQVLKEAISRDGKIDFDDFQYFHALCQLYTRESDWDNLKLVHIRIRQVLPPDDDERAYVSWFYYADAMAMAQAGHLEGAVMAIDEAARIDDSLPELRETQERLREAKGAIDEATQLRDDESISMSLRYSVGVLVILRLIGDNDELREVFRQGTEGLQHEAQIQGNRLATEIAWIRRKYGNLANVVSDFLEQIEEAEQQSGKTHTRVQCPHCKEPAIIERPTAEALTRAGLPMTMALTPERKLLSMAVYSCRSCGGQFNGNGVLPSRPATSSAGDGCFVVTAACGDEHAYPVRVFRALRDDYLRQSRLGRWAIHLYAKIGPQLAALVEKSPILQRGAYELLSRSALYLNRRLLRGVDSTGRSLNRFGSEKESRKANPSARDHDRSPRRE